eukprot:1187006-Prorocentrum_minimum.AAC.1
MSAKHQAEMARLAMKSNNAANGNGKGAKGENADDPLKLPSGATLRTKLGEESNSSAGNIRGTFGGTSGEHPGKNQTPQRGTFGEHSGEHPGEHPGNIRGTFGEESNSSAGNIRGTVGGTSGGTSGEHPGKNQTPQWETVLFSKQ